MKRRMMAIILVLCMVVPLAVPAGASTIVYNDTILSASMENNLDPAICADIYRQLEAQDAAHLFDAFLRVLRSDYDADNTASVASSVYPVYGCYLNYTVDYTYRNVDGQMEYAVTYLDEDKTNEWIRSNTTVSISDVVLDILGFVPVLGDVLTIIGIADKYVTSYEVSAVQQANNRAKIVSIAENVDDTSATIVVGWTDYPYISIPSDSYDVTYIPFPAGSGES